MDVISFVKLGFTEQKLFDRNLLGLIQQFGVCDLLVMLTLKKRKYNLSRIDLFEKYFLETNDLEQIKEDALNDFESECFFINFRRDDNIIDIMEFMEREQEKEIIKTVFERLFTGFEIEVDYDRDYHEDYGKYSIMLSFGEYI